MGRGIFGWVRRDPVIATLFVSLILIWVALIGMVILLLSNNRAAPVYAQETPTVLISPTQNVTTAPTITPFPATPLPNQGRDVAPPSPNLTPIQITPTPRS